MKAVRIFAVFWAVILILGAAVAAPLPQVRFTQYRLPNGLRVILSPDHSNPVVAVCVTYDVGARNEAPGHSGFAHLFEHMMFEGSAHVRPGQHALLIESCGGTDNGATTTDDTYYYEEVPKEQLKLALFLEADRMFSLRLDSYSFEGARKVVEAEKRERHDRQAYDVPDALLWEAAFAKFANNHQAIGTKDDLDDATIEEARAFYQTYYTPQNAVLSIAGDFDPNEVKEVVERYFHASSRQAASPAVDNGEALDKPLPEGRRYLSYTLTRRALSRCYCAYRIPPESAGDYPALVLLSDILGDGRMSRCWRSLVLGSAVASSERVTCYGRRGPGLFTFYAETPTRTRNPALQPIADGFKEIVRELQKDGVTASELARVQNLQRVRAISGQATVLSRCRSLGYNAVCFGSPERINDLPAAYQKVTAADIQRVARKYLTDDNCVELFAR